MLLIGNQSVHCFYFSKIDNFNKYNIKVLTLIPLLHSISLKILFKSNLSKYYHKNLGYFISLYFFFSQFPYIKRSRTTTVDQDKNYYFIIDLPNFNQMYLFLNLLLIEKVKINPLASLDKINIWLPVQSLILSQSFNNLLRNKNFDNKNLLSQINITILTKNMHNSIFSFKNFPFL